MMGASNPHPHCQIWASRTVPTEPSKEQVALLAWRARHDTCLLCEYSRIEEEAGGRMVDANDHFLTVVPFWAVWPFETMVIARRHMTGIDQLTPAERDGLADILQRTTARYDRLFNVSFPYSMGIHQRPTDGGSHDEWHVHLHFYPPLLRSATVRKFLVGYEMLANPQRDITAESAAERLRSV
jgi:UDPglucose--hexose-1-phosphate uridylyltransferase